MKHAKLRTALAALTGSALIGLSAAATAGGFPISVAEAKQRAEARFAELDANGDQSISAEEFATAKKTRGAHHFRHFRALGGHGGDAKHERKRDGGGDDQRAERRQARDAELFRTLDADGDGVLSTEEFSTRKIARAHHAHMRDAMFDRLDADGDGALTIDELPNPATRLEAMDADGDGHVTRDEARAHKQERKAAHGKGRPSAPADAS